MRHFTRTLMAVAILATTASAAAEKFVVDGITYEYKFLISSAGYCVMPSETEYTGEITIPATINTPDEGVQPVMGIYYDAFDSCTGITAINLPEGLTKIGGNAFRNTRITQIKIPSTVKEIGNYAFSMCSNLKSIEIPGSVSTLPESLFVRCTALESVIINEGVTSAQYAVFNDCMSLKRVEFPESMTSISSTLFMNCAVEYVKLGANITTMRPFYTCKKLTEVVMPDNLTEIDTNAFFFATALTKITIPAKVTSIAKRAFEGCSALKNIEMLPMTPPTVEDENAFAVYEGATIVVPFGSKAAYQANAIWSKFNIVERPFNMTTTETFFHIKPGTEKQLDFIFDPEDATHGALAATSSNPAVATVDNSGKITAIDNGFALITVTCDNVFATVRVLVSETGAVGDIAIDTPQAEADAYDVFNFSGMLIRRNCPAESINDLPSGYYILVSPQGARKIRL